MKVKELIAALQEYDEDMEVFIPQVDSHWYEDIFEVKARPAKGIHNYANLKEEDGIIDTVVIIE